MEGFKENYEFAQRLLPHLTFLFYFLYNSCASYGTNFNPSL